MNEYRKTLLISASDLKQSSLVNYNVENQYLMYTIENVQEIHLSEITGTKLYHRLQELVYNTIYSNEDNLENNPAYDELLSEYVKPYLIAKAQHDVIVNITFKIRNTGVYQNNNTNTIASDVSDLIYLQGQFDVSSNAYAERLSKYLCVHKESFAELSESTLSYEEKPTLGEDYASCGLWLGNSNDKNNCGCK